MSKKQFIKIIGAREHNLKNISVDIPKESLVVITGPSGSGKSSLALDVLYTEGKRRYIESLSSYARQFLGSPKRPDVDRIEGLCPAIAIDQKTVGSNPRSTVGTITEIYDYMRVLFARIGELYCPKCSALISAQSPDKVANLLVSNFNDKFITIAAPVANYKKGEFVNELEKRFIDGYYRFTIDGKSYSFRNLKEIKDLKLKRTERHTIDLLLDACDINTEETSRLQDAVEKAFSITSTESTNGICKVFVQDTNLNTKNKEYIYSADHICITCNYSFEEVEPRLFSFNSPVGACKECHGLGIVYSIIDTKKVCSACKGHRLNRAALAITINKKNIYDLGELAISKLLDFFNNLELSQDKRQIIQKLLDEIILRLTFLSDVGLGYLTLNRTSRTLSGGEGQRIRLATQIGSALSGVLYILDEPSIGLHQRDNDRLIKTLHKLRDLGNTVIVVEHDTDTMLNSDYIIDMGPQAGTLGGEVIAVGRPQEVMANKSSLTGDYLSGRKSIEIKKNVREPKNFLDLQNLNSNNLKNITAKFPLGVLCGVSGVSGSGKSTLVMKELVPEVNSILKNKDSGIKELENLVIIDQNPIGRTPRSTPATYLGIFNDIRELFASLPESNVRGYKPGRFSFNVAEGRCSNCKGEGSVTVSMHFLADVVMQCNQCKGARYSSQTLDIKYKNKSIAEILEMTALEAFKFFESYAKVAKKLKLLCEVGLDYIKLGQSSVTLSGGEAQRVKLAYELSKRGIRTLYILDEPTTGLHTHDVKKLLQVLNNLVDKGNSLVVIEHNLDVLKTVDYLIDLGPEGGDEGGQIVAQGTPVQVSKNTSSYTGKYLRSLF